MLLMGVPPMEKRVVVGSEYVVDQHKPKARFPVNMLPCMLHCGISILNRLMAGYCTLSKGRDCARDRH
jgi:hypothetical protein